MTQIMKGTVVYGANNIFTVLPGESEGRTGSALSTGDGEPGSEEAAYLCRIKGKVLKQAREAYNPLAPGDGVSFVPDGSRERRGLITERLPRENAFIRWNAKRGAPQAVAANLDMVVCVASVGTPPFRPRSPPFRRR